MINLRYHIVSITAVFLALGIGVALGSTLIQRGLVDNLNDRLDEQAERLDRTDGENAELRGELEELDELEQQLTREGVGLYDGHLDDVPTLIVTVEGVDEELLELTRRTLRASGATSQGVLSFTLRWEELDELEILELAELTGRPLADADGARTRVMRDLAEELLVAAEPAPEPVEPAPELGEPGVEGVEGTGASDGEVGTDGSETAAVGEGALVPAQDDPDTTTTTEAEVVEEPNGELLGALVERGYLAFSPDAASTPLPDHGARYVVVTTDEADLPHEAALLPLLDELADADPAPAVLAEPLPETADDEVAEDEADDADARPFPGLLVAAVRADPQMQLSITTTDSAGRFIGQSAIVLGLADLARPIPRVGHYGVAEGASSLVPLPEG